MNNIAMPPTPINLIPMMKQMPTSQYVMMCSYLIPLFFYISFWIYMCGWMSCSFYFHSNFFVPGPKLFWGWHFFELF